jgi:hypothetical protein
MDHAFTDQMVRNDPSLREAATRYVLDYKGNFDPILNARQTLIQGEQLGVAHIRTILNVMRADTSIRLEYTPPKNNVVKFPGVFQEEEEVFVPKRAREIRVKGRVRATFGMSTHKRAEVIHYVDHGQTVFTFKEAGARSLIRHRGWEQIWEDRIEVGLRWECSQRNPKVRLLATDEVAVLLSRGLMRICPTCLRIRTAHA